MKKNFLMALLAAATLVGFVACGGSDNPDVPTPPPGPVVTATAKSGLGSYYIKERTGGSFAVFQIALYSTKASGSAFEPTSVEAPCSGLMLSLCNNPADAADPMLKAGTYTVIAGQTPKANSCIGEMSNYVEVNDKGVFTKNLAVKSGTVNVALSGKSYTITANVVLTDNTSLSVTYSGLITFFAVPFSALEENITMPLTGFTGSIEFRGPIFENIGIKADVWLVTLINKEQTQNLFLALFVPPTFVTEDGLPAHLYKVSSTYFDGDYMCAAGEIFLDKGQMMVNMSWYTGADAEGKVRQVPIGGGDMTVEKTGDQYTLKFNFSDDSLYAHKMTGEWTGSLPIKTANAPMRVYEGADFRPINTNRLLSNILR